MNNAIKILFQTGLTNTFSPGAQFSTAERGGFHLTASHTDTLEGGTYHDEWVTGGGQELIRTPDGQAWTRTYVGNTASEKVLTELGISESDIMKFLAQVIRDLGGNTRLDTNVESFSGDWAYGYKVTYKCTDPYILNGVEEIKYKGKMVFVHTFGISKVVEG